MTVVNRHPLDPNPGITLSCDWLGCTSALRALPDVWAEAERQGWIREPKGSGFNDWMHLCPRCVAGYKAMMAKKAEERAAAQRPVKQRLTTHQPRRR